MPTLKKIMTPTLLLDEKIPLAHRRHLLADLCQSESEEATKLLEAVLRSAAKSNGRNRYEEKSKQLEQLLEALEAGPQRPGVFLNLVTPADAPIVRAHVKLQDGASAYPIVVDGTLATGLQRGHCVVLSARAEALLGRDPGRLEVGEEARLEDWLDDRVEVSLRGGDERHVMHVTHELRGRLESGEVTVGSHLLVCPRRAMAFDVVPRSVDELSKFRFLAREEVPDIVAERDIGDPPPFIEQVAEICREEMLSPDVRRKYGLRRSLTLLLTGVSGSGKTLSVSASIRRIYEVMSSVTGLGLHELPPRVLRLEMSKLLSMWLGQSDQNADRLVDEIVQLCSRTVTGPDGTEHELPVIVVLEELDGIARRRGLDHDGVYDRIQTTLLRRLDHTSNRALRDCMIVLFATTNVQHLIDPAWIRRVGGRTFNFGRLRRRGFASVLDKQLGDRPIAGANGTPRGPVKHGIVSDVTAALFSPNGADEPLVEIQFAGTTTPSLKHRRDFLTGSVVDRAVQAACERACRAEQAGTDDPGLTADTLIEAIDQQVRAVVHGLTPVNVTEFVDLPDGVRVTNLRRLPRPTLSAAQLQR